MSEHEQRTPVAISGLSVDDPHLQPAARRPELVERVITILFVVGIILCVGFGVAYVQNLSLIHISEPTRPY